MRVLHAADDVQDCGRQHARLAQLLVESRKLGRGWEFTQQEQISRFLEGGLLGQVMNGVAPITKVASLAIDEGGGGPLEIDVLETPVDLLCGFGLAHGRILFFSGPC